MLTLAASDAKKAFKCLEGACFPKLLGKREIEKKKEKKLETKREKDTFFLSLNIL